ncbi:hypothetical protein JCM10908_007359 [Rhodotorula pacifica]|uniref:snoRNA-binding rRNA-processing protein UTP10 n=1 Tax=Rhodotorula pacifica TaxID=1495444 RepID=UPI0031827A18
MSTSLAAQLQARKTVDSARLQSAKTLKNPPSFIFTPRHASTVTNADLHALAANAWDQLAAIDPFFGAHFKEILGEQAKTLDRTGLTKEENDKVGKTVDRVLRALGKHLLLKPAGVVLEWLIRRFRVQNFNVPGLIALFLPYHATAHFPSALNVIPETNLSGTPFEALIPAKKTLAPLPLVGLVDLFPPFSRSTLARPLLDFVLHLPLDYLKNGETPHRALTAFWLQAIAAYLDRAGTRLPDGERAAVLSTILEVLRSARSAPDTLIASYILVARFALHNPFDAETLRVVLKGVVTNRARSHVADSETDAALVTTLVVISQLGEEDLEIGGGKKFLGNSGWKSLIKTARLDELVVQLANQYDAERFMKPFLQTLAEDALTSEDSLALLSAILTPRPAPDSDDMMTLPGPLIPVLLASCFAAILSNPNAPPSALQRPLSQVYQRYPAVWTAQSAVYTARAKASSDETAVSRLMHVMNGVLGGSSDSTSTLVLTASAPDVALRVQALKDIMKDAETMEAQGNGAFVHDTLVARLAEPEHDIAQVLFTTDSLKTVHRVLDGEEILTAMQPALQSTRDKYLALALAYLAGPFVQQFPDQADAVVQQVFWPRLLATKTDARKHVVAATAIRSSNLAQTHAGLKGVSPVLVTKQEEITAETTDKVVEVIAKNLAAGSAVQIDAAVAFLFERLAVQDKLAAVVALRLVSKMEKSRRVDFVASIFDVLRITSSGLNAIAAEDAAFELISDANAGVLSTSVQQTLYARQGDDRTARLVQGALIVGGLKSIHPVKEASWSWLSSSDASEEVIEYRALCRGVYAAAHSHSGSKGSQALSNALLETLFGVLVTEDAIAFLAAIYTDATVATELRVAALRDTAIFVEVLSAATAKPKGKLVDWQVIVPSLVVALANISDDKRVRVEALKALEVAHASIKGGVNAKVGSVYGRDKFYGDKTTSAHLKYLELADEATYLDKLLTSKAELTLSPTHLRTLHASILDAQSEKDSPKKRKQALSAKVATYLVSHVTCWKTSLAARIRLLQALEGVKDKDKSAALVALIAEATEAGPVQATHEPEAVTEYARLVLAPYDGASRKWLEGEDTQAVETLVTAVEVQDVAGLRAALRKEGLRLIAKTVFTVVRADTRLELLRRLVRLAIGTEARVSNDVTACLRSLKPDGETLAAYLADVKSSLAPPAAKGAKRGRVSVGGTASSTSRVERLPELVALLESVDFADIAASHALLLNLFEILASLVDLPSAPGQTDVSYPGQLVLTALARVVDKVTPESGITGDSIRMTPVLDFMRSSVNPQTYHQSLLLLAQLGPLVPDQLVHNVMPIFTFMGANVLQRDDAYSLRVVDQTLDSIIPALVKATQKTARGRDALLKELKDLLRSFADAATHVPRHRRINLFVRLVETLGAKDFLSAILMLLIDKAGKATFEAVALPLALVEHFAVDVQLAAYRQIVDELTRVLNLEPSFLSDFSADAPSTAQAKEQAINLLGALGYALEAKQLLSKVDSARAAGSETVDPSLTELVRGLLDLASAIAPAFSEENRHELGEAAEYDVHAAIALLSIKAFADALLWLLEMADSSIQPRVFALLRTRLPHVKPTRRADLTPAIIAVVEAAQSRLGEGGEALDATLDTLDTIAVAAVAEEDAALAKTVPGLISLAGDEQKPALTRAKALDVLKKLTHRLGPRLIPLVGKLVPFALAVLQAQAQAGADSVAAIVSGAYETLEGLFVSVPAFIGGQLDKIFSAALATEVMALSAHKGAQVTKARATLLSTASKKLPAKTLFPAIIRLHGSLSGQEREPLLGLLDLLNRGLRHGKTSDVADHYRSIFKLFLTVFDLRRVHSHVLGQSDVVSVEDHALGAFVQFILKLNEQLFRPLFLRTYDWAVIDLAEEEDAAAGLVARRTVLYRVVDRLLGQLKSIFVPYFAFMLDQTVDLLEQAAKGDMRDAALWAAVASALTKAFEFDENGFWTPARLVKLATPIAQQIEVPTAVAPTEAYNALVTAYVSLLGSHESHLKTFNSRLLHLTRSDDLRVKRAAIDTLDVVWEEVGDGMLGLVPETTPFLAETREETEGGVEAATRKLIKRIEEHLGESLDEYLEQ